MTPKTEALVEAAEAYTMKELIQKMDSLLKFASAMGFTQTPSEDMTRFQDAWRRGYDGLGIAIEAAAKAETLEQAWDRGYIAGAGSVD